MEKCLSIEDMLTLARKVKNWELISENVLRGLDMLLGYSGSVEELRVEVCWARGIFGDKYEITVVGEGVVLNRCHWEPKKVKPIYEFAERIYDERLKQIKKRGIERAIELAAS